MFKKFLLIPLFCMYGWVCFAQNIEQEATLKAAFIYNFTRYIEWINNNNSDDVFIIGVVGNSALLPALKDIARTNTVQGKRIIIKVFDRPEEIGYCHFLFIPANTIYPLNNILDRVGKGVLTISETAGLARRGTGINFIIVNNKIKFEANPNVIYSSGLKASSQLLKLAIIVD